MQLATSIPPLFPLPLPPPLANVSVAQGKTPRMRRNVQGESRVSERWANQNSGHCEGASFQRCLCPEPYAWTTGSGRDWSSPTSLLKAQHTLILFALSRRCVSGLGASTFPCPANKASLVAADRLPLFVLYALCTYCLETRVVWLPPQSLQPLRLSTAARKLIIHHSIQGLERVPSRHTARFPPWPGPFLTFWGSSILAPIPKAKPVIHFAGTHTA